LTTTTRLVLRKGVEIGADVLRFGTPVASALLCAADSFLAGARFEAAAAFLAPVVFVVFFAAAFLAVGVFCAGDKTNSSVGERIRAL
jgi:hypothetical protein